MKKDLPIQEEGQGVGGIYSGVGVKVTSHLGDAENKKVLCDGNCHCCSDTNGCYDLRKE